LKKKLQGKNCRLEQFWSCNGFYQWSMPNKCSWNQISSTGF